MFRDGESHENQQLRSCAAGVTCKRNYTFQIFLCFVVFGIRLQQYTHDYCQSMEEKKTCTYKRHVWHWWYHQNPSYPYEPIQKTTYKTTISVQACDQGKLSVHWCFSLFLVNVRSSYMLEGQESSWITSLALCALCWTTLSSGACPDSWTSTKAFCTVVSLAPPRSPSRYWSNMENFSSGTISESNICCSNHVCLVFWNFHSVRFSAQQVR